jgi:hypothetical protein
MWQKIHTRLQTDDDDDNGFEHVSEIGESLQVWMVTYYPLMFTSFIANNEVINKISLLAMRVRERNLVMM